MRIPRSSFQRESLAGVVVVTRALGLLAMVGTLLFVAGCKPKAAGGPSKMPPPQVIVAEARTERVVCLRA